LVGNVGLARVLGRFLDELRVDFDADASRPVLLRGGDDNPAVA